MTESRSRRDPRDLPESMTCSIERALTVLGERWTLLILREIHAGNGRFADIQRRLGVAANLLSTRLTTLVDTGVVTRREYREAGSRTRHEYTPTDAGRDALVVLGALQQWGDRHVPRDAGPSAGRRDRRTGSALDVSFTDAAGVAVPVDAVAFLETDAASSSAVA